MIKTLAAIFVSYFLSRKASCSVDHNYIYMFILFFVLFDLILYVPINKFSVVSG